VGGAGRDRRPQLALDLRRPQRLLNNFLITTHLSSNIISWLSDPGLAMGCVIAVVVWAGTPFYSMTFLAGLQAIPRELYEAAEIDGASIVQQFFYVTVPRLRTIFLTTVMLSTIWTATNLQFVLVLTRGGPASRRRSFPTSPTPRRWARGDSAWAPRCHWCSSRCWRS